MADSNFLPLATDAYLADCAGLNSSQHGVYLVMLMLSWRRPNCALPADRKELKRMLGCVCSDMHGNRFNRLIEPIIERFFTTEGEWLIQKRLRKEREFVEKTRRNARENAKKRWAKSNENNDLANANGYAPTPTPTPTLSLKNQSPITAPEYKTPTGARDEETQAAAVDSLAVDPKVVDMIAPGYEIRGVPRQKVELELRALCVHAGSSAPVTQALCQAMRRNTHDPIAYASAVINGRQRDMQAARDEAAAPKQDDSMKAFHEIFGGKEDERTVEPGTRAEGTRQTLGGIREISSDRTRPDADRDLQRQADIVPIASRFAGRG